MTISTPEQIAAQAFRNHMGVGALIATVAGTRTWDEDTVRQLMAEAVKADRAQCNPLVLSFEPDAIRDHFDVDDPNPTEGMTDEQLEAIALDALQDDRLYDVFHELLNEGVNE